MTHDDDIERDQYVMVTEAARVHDVRMLVSHTIEQACAASLDEIRELALSAREALWRDDLEAAAASYSIVQAELRAVIALRHYGPTIVQASESVTRKSPPPHEGRNA